MQRESTARRAVTLPAEAFLHLRRALREEAGSPAATHVMHSAGFATGDLLYEEFSRSTGAEPATLDEHNFWDSLGGFLEERGWGRISHTRIHPGLGALDASDWGESWPDSGEGQPGCAFSTGLLAQLLGRAADGAIAVLEVECASRGDARCRFLFGSEHAIEALYRSLLEGTPLPAALEAL